MSQQINLKVAGLYTHPNELSEVPEGALLVADDIVIDEESVAQPRRGYEQGKDIGGTLNKLFSYKGKQIAHYDTNSLAYENGSFTQYSGTYDPVDASNRVRAAQANQNFYFTTDSGVYKLDEVAATPRLAGVPKGISMGGSTTGGSGFLLEGDQVAYRLVWGYEDANKNLILGAPSQRLVVENPSGSGSSKNVDIQVDIPDGITTDYFFQIYRTVPTTSPSDPGEEMGIIVEEFPTGAEITAGSLTFSDETPVGLEGATLYTAPSQEGLLQANDSPPRAKDIANIKGYTWYANTVSKHRVIFTILSADGGELLEVLCRLMTSLLLMASTIQVKPPQTRLMLSLRLLLVERLLRTSMIQLESLSRLSINILQTQKSMLTIFQGRTISPEESSSKKDHLEAQVLPFPSPLR